MKTPHGFLTFRFLIFGAWGLSVTELRTYRSKLLYVRSGLPYNRKNLLQHAEQITVDKALLYNAFIPCLNWQSPNTTVMTFDSTNWQLSLCLNGKHVSFSHDTETDGFNALVSTLEKISQKPFL